MPFDGTETQTEFRIIDKMREVLGPNGEFWRQRRNSDRHGKRCIVGALQHVQKVLDADDDHIYCVYCLLTSVCDDSIEGFNDQPGRKFEDIVSALQAARNLAAVFRCYE